MRKIADRIILIAHISISTIFVFVGLLIFINIIPLNIVEGALVVDSFVLALIIVLVALYVVFSGYLIYSTFVQRNYIKQILLYRDADSSTKATIAVIKKIAKDNSRLVEGLTVKKLQISANDMQKLKLEMVVDVVNDDVAGTVDTMRCLLIDSYMSILGLSFETIDFKIRKVVSKYEPDVNKATNQAKVLGAGRKLTHDIYQQPVVEEQPTGKIESETVQPVVEETTAQPAEQVEEVQQPVVEEPQPSNTESKPMFGTPESNIMDDVVVEIEEDTSDADTTENQDTVEENSDTTTHNKPNKKKKK